MIQPVLVHAREHTWLWVSAFAALGLIMMGVRLFTPGAFAFMMVGVLIMLKSQGADILAIITQDPVVEEDEPALSGGVAGINELAR